jgi:hypothetical protein
MPELPEHIDTTAIAGGQWSWGYTLTNQDGTPVNLSNSTFEFVIRPNIGDVTEPALVSVTTASSGQGQITVNSNTVTVTLNASATALLGQGQRPYALWQNPGQPSATPWVAGTFFSSLVAAA